MSGNNDIIKRGYLKKVKNSRKRYYVLRYESNSGPGRIECYDNERKFNRNDRPRQVIKLADCWKIIKMINNKHQHAMSYYTQDSCYSLYTKSAEELESWLVAIDEVKHLDSRNTKSNKNCWRVTVIDRDVAKSKQLAGVYNLELKSTEMELTRLGSSDLKEPLILKYLYVRSCGHTERFFFVENGHSSSIGPGKLWMQVDDQVISERIHAKALSIMRKWKGDKLDTSMIEDPWSTSFKDSNLESTTISFAADELTESDFNLLHRSSKRISKRFSFSHLIARIRSRSASNSSDCTEVSTATRRKILAPKLDRPSRQQSETIQDRKMIKNNSDSDLGMKGLVNVPFAQKGEDFLSHSLPSDRKNLSTQLKCKGHSLDNIKIEGRKIIASTAGDYVNIDNNQITSENCNKACPESNPAALHDYINVEPKIAQVDIQGTSNYIDMAPTNKSPKTSDYVDMEAGKHQSADYVNIDIPAKNIINDSDYIDMKPQEGESFIQAENDRNENCFSSNNYIKPISQSTSGNSISISDDTLDTCKDKLTSQTTEIKPIVKVFIDVATQTDADLGYNYIKTEVNIDDRGNYIIMQPGKDSNCNPSDYIDIDYRKNSVGNYNTSDNAIRKNHTGIKKEFADYIEMDAYGDTRSGSVSSNSLRNQTRYTISSASNACYLPVSQSLEHRHSWVAHDFNNKYNISKRANSSSSTTKSIQQADSKELSDLRLNKETEFKGSISDFTDKNQSITTTDIQQDKKAKESKSQSVSGGRCSTSRSPSKVIPPFLPPEAGASPSLIRKNLIK